MAFHSGNGGGITVGGGSELNIGRYTVRAPVRSVENTHSGTSGATNFEAVVRDVSWEVEIPFDDAAIPDTDMGLVPGNKVTIVWQLGSSGKTVTTTNTLVEGLEFINDPSGDIVRARVTGKGGSYTAATT
jgi:hypothetical protein